MYWRSASYNLTRFFLALALGLLFGVMYANAEYTSYAGINSGMGMLFSTTGFIGFIAFTSILPISSEDRLAFYRERASQTYNALWYFVGATVVEIPYVFFSVLLFLVPFYPMVGFTGFTGFLAYWVHLSLHVLWQAYFGQLMSYLMPTVEVAQIPQGYKWLYNASPQKYSLALVAAIAFGDCPTEGGSEIGCQVMTGVPPSLPSDLTVKAYLEEVFLMKHGDIWKNFAIVLGIILLTCVLSLLALRFVNHQKK